MEKFASQIIIDILNREMCMPPDSVWLREQNKTIKNDNGLYISVGLLSSPAISNITEMVEKINPATGLPAVYEVNQVQLQEAILIDVMSSSASSLAMRRNWEVIAALQSFYSQRQQEKYNFKIFRIPRSLLDTSSAEGGSMLQRYSVTIIAHTWYRKEKLFGDYYDDFTVELEFDTYTETFETAFEPTAFYAPAFQIFSESGGFNIDAFQNNAFNTMQAALPLIEFEINKNTKRPIGV